MARKILGIAGIFFVGVALGIIVNVFSPVNLLGFLTKAGDVSSQLESLYELVNPEVDVSVVKVDEVSGMYKVLFKAVDALGATNYQEVYITQDGKFLSQNMIIITESINQLTKSKNFIDCLDSKNVRIAGIANNTGTQLQFNALGLPYSGKLYVSCDGESVQQCLDFGITQVPTIIYNNQGYPGPQPVEFFENLTACTF